MHPAVHLLAAALCDPATRAPRVPAQALTWRHVPPAGFAVAGVAAAAPPAVAALPAFMRISYNGVRWALTSHAPTAA